MVEISDGDDLPATAIGLERDAWTRAGLLRGVRIVAEEIPVALVHNAVTTAVMIATPADLEDFAIGFSLSEGIIDHVSEIRRTDIIAGENGVEARIWLERNAAKKQLARRRQIVGPTGCGLCGVESLAAAKPTPRSLAHVGGGVDAEDILIAFAALQKQQILGKTTRAVHAAAFWRNQTLEMVREDVGRHNALDKLIGACARQGKLCHDGILLLTSRVSIELVQKAAVLGAPIVCAVSAPTALAVRTARDAGLTLVAVVREDGFEIFSRPDRVKS